MIQGNQAQTRWCVRGRVSRRILGAAALAAVFTGGCGDPKGGVAGGAGDKPKPVEWVDVPLRHGAMWLDELDLSVIVQSWGEPKARKSVEGRPITIGGKSYRRGVGTHAESEWIIDLQGAATAFDAWVGVDDEVTAPGAVEFMVVVDGAERWRSGAVKPGEAARAVHVDLSGAQQMILVVEAGDDGIDRDHADWAAAMITRAPGAGVAPRSAKFMEETPSIVFDPPRTPVIHAPRITGGTEGRPFLFRVPATGAGPLRFEAHGLPDGLTIESDTGIIRGVPWGSARFRVRVVVEAPEGRAENWLTIVIGPRQLALTPPMGWNSWNVWGTSVDDAKVRAAADYLVSTGLACHGYQYVNIDDAWEGTRGEDGRIRCNEKFPDMKALADYVHARGLKLGIYSSPGPKTCAGYEGSYEHELLDAQTWAEWGIDLVKYDWCSYGKIAPKEPSTADHRRPYEVMRAALDQVDRDIVYSLCQYGMGEVWTWGADVGGNYWRTTGDITDTWASMSGIGFGQDGKEAYAGPGRWNDPDMLVVGRVGWGPKLRQTRLRPNEQITHITLWAILAAPLLIGCDLSQMDPFTVAVLTNPEVIEVNQDPLGRQGRRVWKEGHVEVWARPLADGTVAAGLFNRGWTAAEVTARWEDLGVRGAQPVRNLWERRDVGVHEGAFRARVPRHGAVMVRIGTPGEAGGA